MRGSRGLIDIANPEIGLLALDRVVGVSQEFQSLLGFLVEITDAPQCIGICRCRFERRKDDGLIRAHSRTLVHGMRVASLDKYIRFGAHDKEGRAECEDEEPLKS